MLLIFKALQLLLDVRQSVVAQIQLVLVWFNLTGVHVHDLVIKASECLVLNGHRLLA